MTDEEKKKFSGGVELSLDISNETMQNLKEALGINELEQIHKRFENGTETLEDIMYHCLNYGMDLKNGKQLKLVETKYFDKLVEYIEKQQKEIKLAKQSLKENAKIADERNQLLVENQKKDKIIQAIAFKLADYVMYYEYDKCRNPEMIKQKAKELIEYFEKEGK